MGFLQWVCKPPLSTTQPTMYKTVLSHSLAATRHVFGGGVGSRTRKPLGTDLESALLANALPHIANWCRPVVSNLPSRHFQCRANPSQLERQNWWMQKDLNLQGHKGSDFTGRDATNYVTMHPVNWWIRQDSNLRRLSRQIYSLLTLTACILIQNFFQHKQKHPVLTGCL